MEMTRIYNLVKLAFKEINMQLDHNPTPTTPVTLSGHLVFPVRYRYAEEGGKTKALIAGIVHSAAAIANYTARHEGPSSQPVGVDTILFDGLGQSFIVDEESAQVRIQLDDAVFNSAQATYDFLESLAYLLSNRLDIHFDSCLLLQIWNSNTKRKDFVEVAAVSSTHVLEDMIKEDRDLSLVPGKEFVAIKEIGRPSPEEISSRFYGHKKP